MDLNKYTSMFKDLLPVGLAWPRQEPTKLTQTIECYAIEAQRVDERVADLLRESYPLTCAELLPEWEKMTGLPESCSNVTQTFQQRREAVHRKLSSIGGQSVNFYINAAAQIGYEITITEFRPFRVGENAAGDPVNGEDWANTCQVNAPETTIREFRAGEGTAGEPLRNWGNELLECVITRIKPAHTIVLFSYGA